jgi:tetratricopeptide (TPR) repeat protein
MPIYAFTIFTGAFLLFLVQPLIGKYILPWFGGAPAVWTTCMLFFQLLLLAGYAYAHCSARWLKPRQQAILHLLLLAAALALLPITPGDSWKPTDGANPTWRILGLLLASIGLPYFVLAATSPLLQHWFSRTHPGVSPFRLYALSNVGSVLALLSFPVYFETEFTRSSQTLLWGWGLALYAVSCGLCAWKLWRTKANNSTDGSSVKGKDSEEITLTPLIKVLWVLLPACASVLLLATTNMICQEVAVIPFLWVLPLTLYLLSFIICFDSPRWYVRRVFVPALVISLAAICWALFKGADASTFFQLSIYCFGLFVCCMVGHGELYRLRPDPTRLTAYYLMIAGGGALGGLFVAVVAPLIFDNYYELQVGLLLCGLLVLTISFRETQPLLWRPRKKAGKKNQAPDGHSRRQVEQFVLITGLVALGAAFWVQSRPLASVAAANQVSVAAKTNIHRSRNFYGVLTVFKYDDDAEHMHYVQLSHGRTLHGQQFTDPEKRHWPTTYFNESTGIGLLLRALPAGNRRIGLIGLGAGTLAAYPEAGDVMRIYEINPEVETIARTDFTYLADCKGKVEVVLGDARLSMEREAPQNYDLFILDAFNSDAIPVHLLTKEAFAIYEKHLKTNGLIAVHISNKNLNLDAVIANLARQFHYKMVVVDSPAPRDKPWMMSASWALLAREASGEKLLELPAIQLSSRPPLTNNINIPLWTDDYASLFQILRSDNAPQMDSAFTDEQCQAAFNLYQHGDTTGAINQFRTALKKMPRSPILLSNLAFLLTSCPDPAQRNLTEATALAEKACQLTHYHAPDFLSTLAAVYSEGGRFTEAVQMAEKASALAQASGETELLQKNQELLKLYRANRPFHEAATP